MEDIRKISLLQLKDILYRESVLLRNNKLIQQLPDKGESIKKVLNKVEQEIKFREELESVGTSINKFSLSENGKHVEKLCDIEKTPEKERYKPFSTLNRIQQVQPNSKVFKIMEGCVYCNKPTKLITLPESIDILKKQDERVKEQQVKARNRHISEKLKEYENEENEDNDSEAGSSSEEYSEREGGNG